MGSGVAWSAQAEARLNIRFNERKVQRATIFRTFFGTLTGTVPVWCYGVYNQSGYDTVISSSL